jgi:transposase
VRVTTALNRVLSLPGTVVTGVGFSDGGLVLGVRRRARLHRCPCGRRAAARYDGSTRRWRHVDFGATRALLEAQIARVGCRGCGRVCTEGVPWARPGARATRDFEDVIAWLAQRMDKTSVSTLMRTSWETVNTVVKRVVGEHLDDPRLDDLFHIGVDEISYRRGHRYLTLVADHDTGRVVWAAKTRTTAAFEDFFAALGAERVDQLQAITCDASSVCASVAAAQAPQARICLDPFHIIKWANEALDAVYRSEPAPPAEWINRRYSRRNWRQLRHALGSGAERLEPDRRAAVNALRRRRYQLWRAWILKEELRQLYQLPGDGHKIT